MPRQSSKILTPAQKKEALIELKAQIKELKAAGKEIMVERKNEEKVLKEVLKREAANTKALEALNGKLEALTVPAAA
jgi:hypothetical protein